MLSGATGCFAQLPFLLRQKLLPGAKEIFGRNAKSAFDEETESGLPGRAEIEKRAAAQAIQVPEEFFQSIGNAVGFAKFRCSRRADRGDRSGAVGARPA